MWFKRTSSKKATAAFTGDDVVVPFKEPSGLDVNPSSGVPSPILFQSEDEAILIYRGYGTILAWFTGALTKFGYPNDEALGGHPLYARGLGCYGVFEVRNSSWIKTLAQQNRVCFPDFDAFSGGRHFCNYISRFHI